jgi:hypothetical protein
MGINTQSAGDGQERALYVWHETEERYPWPDLLRLWAAEAASLQPGDAGLWICDRLLTFAAEAAENRITTPAQHSKYQADTLAAASAYLAQLERDANWDPGHPRTIPATRVPARCWGTPPPRTSCCRCGWVTSPAMIRTRTSRRRGLSIATTRGLPRNAVGADEIRLSGRAVGHFEFPADGRVQVEIIPALLGARGVCGLDVERPIT